MRSQHLCCSCTRVVLGAMSRAGVLNVQIIVDHIQSCMLARDYWIVEEEIVIAGDLLSSRRAASDYNTLT